jgi:hypothetical protein
MTADGIHIQSTPVQILATDNSTTASSRTWGIAWSCRGFEQAKIRTGNIKKRFCTCSGIV